MRNWIAVAATVFVVYIFISFLVDGGVAVATNEPARGPQNAPPTQTRQMVSQQVLNPATATAVAAMNPTVTPTPSPTLIPHSFAPGGEKEAISSIWFNRLAGFLVLLGTGWFGHLFYQMRMYEIEKAAETAQYEMDKKAEMQKQEIEALTRMKINPRPILSTNISSSEGNGEPTITLNNREVVAKKLVVEFLKAVFSDDDRGLVVSRWKTSPGWQQKDIEAILDHLGEAEIITKRVNGKACEWQTTPERRTLAHVFRLSPYELEE
jgi:hypothetical protein